MEVDTVKRNKNQILDSVRAVVDGFNQREDITTVFGEPVIAFISTTHPLFDTFFARSENDHPKKLYRPGNTLIVHYVPWDGGVAKSNEDPGAKAGEASAKAGEGGADMPSEEWLAADRESLWLAMEINKTIKQTLNKVGRLHSNTSSMIDWDREKHRYGWSNKIAAFIAGIGSFGPAGSLHSQFGYGGRAGSIITAAMYADDNEEMDLDSGKLEEIFEQVMRDCCFEGSGGVCSEEMISACPGEAISSKGIDRAKCQAWCEKIDTHTPSPEVCGKCFRFRK